MTEPMAMDGNAKATSMAPWDQPTVADVALPSDAELGL